MKRRSSARDSSSQEVSEYNNPKHTTNMATLTAEQIPWDSLKSWGIQRLQIENNKEAMDRLLSGRFTSPLPFFRNEGDMHLDGNAAIRCYQGKESVKIEMQCIGPKITENSRLYVFGVELSKDQVKNLCDTGHAGSVVESKDGSKKYLVSLNKETNRLVTYPAEAVNGPKDGMIAGVKLSEDQMKKYCAGEAVYLKNMVKSDGSRFDACVQFSAVARKNEFTHPQWLKEAQKAEKKAKEQIAAAVQEEAPKKGKGRSR